MMGWQEHLESMCPTNPVAEKMGGQSWLPPEQSQQPSLARELGAKISLSQSHKRALAALQLLLLLSPGRKTNSQPHLVLNTAFRPTREPYQNKQEAGYPTQQPYL